MTEQELDRLLAAPLAAVDDAGFSARVMARTSRPWLGILEAACLLVTAIVVLAFLPLPVLAGAIEKFTLGLASSPHFAAAVLIVVLTMSFARTAAD